MHRWYRWPCVHQEFWEEPSKKFQLDQGPAIALKTTNYVEKILFYTEKTVILHQKSFNLEVWLSGFVWITYGLSNSSKLEVGEAVFIKIAGLV